MPEQCDDQCLSRILAACRWLDAAAVVVDLLWSWAPLHSGLGHDVPVFMTARRKTAQAQAYALPRCQLDAWHSGGLAPTGNMVPGVAFHNARTVGPSVLLKTSCSIGTIGRFCRQLRPWTRLSCKRNLGSQRSTLIRYAHVNRKVPRGAMSIWQYSGHIVIRTTDGSRSGLSWHVCHGAT